MSKANKMGVVQLNYSHHGEYDGFGDHHAAHQAR